MGQVYLRAAAAIGALGLGLLAVSPAVAATGAQAGANAVTLKIADQDGQGSGTFTATYANGHETTSGTSKPPFSDPSGQKNLTGGVLAQEATARPGFSAACAGLAGDGGSVINIGDSSCLAPGNLLTGSFGSLDPSTLVPSQANLGQLNQIPGLGAALDQIQGQTQTGSQQLTNALDQALTQAKSAVGDGGLKVNLDMVDGRCTASDGRTTGDADLTNAKVQFITPAKTFTLLDFKPHPAPNTHVFTNLQAVADAIVGSFKDSLTESLDGNSQLSDALGTLQTKVIDTATAQLQANLGPLEQNLLDITLNQQSHPTPHSIKVRALNVDLLPAAKSQLSGNPLANLQVGNAACAPVDTAAVLGAEANRPAARTAATPRTPTGVSSGLASAPAAQDQGIARSTWALVALGGVGLMGAGLVAARRLFG